MSDLVQLIVTGVANGCVYGLIALGFVLIYKATEMVNFAQGDMMMIGAFVALTFVELGVSYWLMVPGTMLVMAGFGIVLERVAIRPMVGEPQFAVLMLTIGLGFVLRAVAGTIWGHEPVTLQTPYGDVEPLTYGAYRLPVELIVVVLGTLLICTLIYLFFKYTKFGVAMQAASQNQLAAYYVGIPVRRVVSLTWALSAIIAAIAGILVAPLWPVEPILGLVGIKAFVAAIVGGFGSLPGAILGGIAIGVVEQFGTYVLSSQGIHGFGEPAVYLLLLLMLFLRPQGLIATLQKKKV